MANIARQDQKNRIVNVQRTQLLDKLRTNKEKHLAEYAEALAGYKELATEKLKKAYENAKGSLEKNLERGLKKISEFDPENDRYSDYLTLIDSEVVELPVPKNYSEEYDAAIDMVFWDTREVLELTHAEFTCFVRDRWDWTSDFIGTTSIYNNKLK